MAQVPVGPQRPQATSSGVIPSTPGPRGLQLPDLLPALCLPPGRILPVALDTARELSGQEWRRLGETATGSGVAAILAYTLPRVALWDVVPAEQQDALATAAETLATHNAQMIGLWHEVQTQTESRGYRLVLAKESAAIATAYPATNLRYIGDYDVLVETDQKAVAEAFVRDELGYRGLVDFHHEMRDGGEQLSGTAHAGAMLAEAQRVAWAGGESFVLAPRHNVIWLAWHDFNHRWGHLHRLLDLLWVLAADGASLDWAEIIALATAWGIAPALTPNLLMASRLLDDPALREAVSKLLAGCRVTPDELERQVASDLWAYPLRKARRLDQWSRVLRLELLSQPVRAAGSDPGEALRLLMGRWQLAKRRRHSSRGW